MSKIERTLFVLTAAIIIHAAGGKVFSEAPRIRAIIEIQAVDAVTGKPVPGAKVSGTFTDSAGAKTDFPAKDANQRGLYEDYAFNPGQYSFTVAAPGFQPAKVTGEVNATDIKITRRLKKQAALKKEGAPETAAALPVPAALPAPAAETKEKTPAPAAASAQCSSPMTKDQAINATGMGENVMRSAVMDTLLYENPRVPGMIIQAVRIMPASCRESLLKGLLVFAKEYISSDMFAKAYEEKRKNSLGLKPTEENPNFPVSAKDLIKKKLQYFQSESASVDFEAETVLQNGRLYFKKPEYESKSRIWKKCFCMGPQLTKAAVNFASEWLDSMGK